MHIITIGSRSCQALVRVHGVDSRLRIILLRRLRHRRGQEFARRQDASPSFRIGLFAAVIEESIAGRDAEDCESVGFCCAAQSLHRQAHSRSFDFASTFATGLENCLGRAHHWRLGRLDDMRGRKFAAPTFPARRMASAVTSEGFGASPRARRMPQAIESRSARERMC